LDRQHGVPLLLTSGAGAGVAVLLKPVTHQGGGDATSEADIQALIQAHPACLPITEIDAIFAGPVPICTELNTPAGAIDNFMVTPTGLPVLVECKLWRNPEGRREVVGQILDYAKELSRWSSSDLQREVRRRELPIYFMPNGDRLVAPRVLARTTIVTRNVVALPDGYAIEEAEDPTNIAELDPERSAVGDAHQGFWAEFLNHLMLDDPEQPRPKAARMGYIGLSLPARTSWLTVYYDSHVGKVGVYLSSWRSTSGAYAMQAVVEDWGAVKEELGGSAMLSKVRDGRPTVADSLPVGSLDQTEVRAQAFGWLAERVNTFVNVIRPRMRSAAADYQSRGG